MRLVDKQILEVTHRLLEIKSNCNKSDLDSLVEAASGTTRKVMDPTWLTIFSFWGDLTLFPGCSLDLLLCVNRPLLNGSLREALENAEKAVVKANA